MSIDDRMARVQRLGRVLPDSAGGDPARAMLAATIADVEAKVTAALSLFIQGNTRAVIELMGDPTTMDEALAGLPVLAAFGAANEALTAAIGDDPTRGYAALATLTERAAEYAAAQHELITGHAASGPAK